MQAVPTLIAAARESRLRVRPATATIALIALGLIAMPQIVGAAAQQSIQDSPDGFTAAQRPNVLAAPAPWPRSDAVHADLHGLIAEAFDLPAIAAAAVRPAGEAATAAQHGRLGRVLGLRMTEELLRRRIVDVTRDGVSIVITQRQEIASALRAQRTLDTVIDDIERRAIAAAERP